MFTQNLLCQLSGACFPNPKSEWAAPTQGTEECRLHSSICWDPRSGLVTTAEDLRLSDRLIHIAIYLRWRKTIYGECLQVDLSLFVQHHLGQ